MIKSIILQNFRNYRFRQFDFAEEINVITGKNGIGKTNLLEAVSLISGDAGIRNAEIKELNQDFNNPFLIGFETNFGRIGIYNSNGNRKFQLENETVKAKHLDEKIKIVSIIPEDEFILKSTPSEKRQFLDRIVGIINKDHIEILKSYKNLTAQRIKILEQSADATWLNAIEKQIAQAAILIAINRVILTEEIEFEMQKISFSISGRIILNGDLENKIKNRNFISSVEEQIFAHNLLKSRDLDRITKRTLTGFEKTNFDLWFIEKNISSFYTSSGEQKKLLFLFFLSLIQMLLKRDFKVIFLIDEVISKLDSDGKSEILKILQALNVQTFLTCTNDENIYLGQNKINTIKLF